MIPIACFDHLLCSHPGSMSVLCESSAPRMRRVLWSRLQAIDLRSEILPGVSSEVFSLNRFARLDNAHPPWKKTRVLDCCFCRDVKPRRREKKSQSKLARSPEIGCSLIISWMEERKKKKKRYWLVLQIKENTLRLVWVDGNSSNSHWHSRLISFFQSLLCSWNNEYAEGEKFETRKGNQCQATTVRRIVSLFEDLLWSFDFSSSIFFSFLNGFVTKNRNLVEHRDNNE